MSKDNEITLTMDGKQVDFVRKDSIEVKPKHGKSLYQVGAKVFIRTVTMYIAGVITFVSDSEIVLEKAAWVASTGKFHDALKTGVFSEVEPFPAGVCSVGRGAIVDATLWDFDLPLAKK